MSQEPAYSQALNQSKNRLLCLELRRGGRYQDAILGYWGLCEPCSRIYLTPMIYLTPGYTLLQDICHRATAVPLHTHTLTSTHAPWHARTHVDIHARMQTSTHARIHPRTQALTSTHAVSLHPRTHADRHLCRSS